MCRLGGEFAGILRVHVPAARRTALEAALKKLDGLAITVRADARTAEAAPARLAALEVIGPDRPGIVREISTALAAQRVNVEELATECASAPMSGEPLFQARAKLLLPAGVDMSALRAAVEKAVPGLTVEIALGDGK
jgi:glycine cleavage system regulatory protein